jgi:hypothetical protein
MLHNLLKAAGCTPTKLVSVPLPSAVAILEPVPKIRLGLIILFDELRANGLGSFVVSLSNYQAQQL